MENLYYLYWIHRASHTDIKTQGYVGISKNPVQRFKEHKSLKTGKHLKNALEKYDDILYDVIETFLTLEECLHKEIELRPREHIGWNMCIGGGMPPRVTKETAIKISKTLKQKGTTPYCENTHSKESIIKSNAKKSLNGGQWWHNPRTKEYRYIKTAFEEIPIGWERGRVLAKNNQIKVRGEDYNCNVKKWKLEIDGSTVFVGFNLKDFLRENHLLGIYANLIKSAKTNRPYKSYKYKKSFKLVKI